jgi:uncharacterized protein involved in response to NO
MYPEQHMPEARLSVDINPSRGGLAPFALGFRPFFLGAGVVALALMGVWLGVLFGYLPPPGYYPGTAWHAHEMLFGYVAAVIAGFLLTAVRNWTGMPTPTGARLGALFGLWLAARVAPFLPVPGLAVAALDLAFFPVLALSLARPLWRGDNRANRVFLALLAAMTLAALLVHLGALGLAAGTAMAGDRLMLDLAVLTLLVVAGRVMPFFTERGVPGARANIRHAVELLTFTLAPALVLAHLVGALAGPWRGLATEIGAALAAGLALVQAARFLGWHDSRAWRNPMLAVLYTGYLWLILGLALDAVAGLGWIAPFPALHALTAGAFGVFTLGMMTRVTLGHTGRVVESSPATSAAFVLINAAALARVLPPLLAPGLYGTWLVVSGVLWMLAFAVFLWVYAPMLLRPRIDGRPG